MSGCHIRFDTKSVLSRIDSIQAKTHKALQIIADSAVKSMEEYAKNTARWTDRTGNARQRMEGRTRWEGSALIAAITHNVDYAIWLELAHQKKYAILQEALDSQAPNLIEAYKRFLGQL